ncbi:MAG: hypothetical protein RIQ65_149 [Pseudomonadota bacterium]|jgi:hypothetical protein
MNKISFKLSKYDLTLFKKVLKLKVIPQNFLIKRDDKKNIIIVFLDYYSQLKSPTDHIVFTTDYKSEIDFMVFKKKVPIILSYTWVNEKNCWKQSVTKQLSPIFIPPVDEYEVTILLKENILKMKSKLMKFEFPLDDTQTFILEKLAQEELEKQT